MAVNTVTIDKARVKRQFGVHAPTYDRHAAVQARMAERLAGKVAVLEPAPRLVLEIGCGTGYLTELLLKVLPGAIVTAVDIAEQMIGATANRLRDVDRLELVAGDAEEIAFDEDRFDLVVSNATIQWFLQPRDTLQHLADALVHGGAMLHSTLGPATFSELFATLSELEQERGIVATTRGIPLKNGPSWSELLDHCGLLNAGVTTRLEHEHYSNCRAFLTALRGMGTAVGGGGMNRYSLLSEAIHRYDQRYQSNGGVYATFEIIELVGYRRQNHRRRTLPR